MVAHSAFTAPQAAPEMASIKLLDLLTNRYHLGILRESTPTHLEVELSGASRFCAGQRVRFVVAEDQPLVSRTAMRRGFITNVLTGEENRVSVHVALLSETAVA